MADARKDPRPTLTIELIHEGDKLRRKYYVPASHALEHVQIVDTYRDIGAAYTFGDLRGMGALRAVLLNDRIGVLQANLKGDCLDAAGRLLFEVLFGCRTVTAMESDVQQILRAAFGENDPQRNPSLKDKPLRVRILARDHELAALPWQATMWRDEPLTRGPNSWTFELVSKFELGLPHEMRLPTKILVVVPELPEDDQANAEGLARTSRKHVRALQELFNRFDQANDVRIVRHEHEMQKALAEFKPNILYFYGHGDASNGQNRLVLANGGRPLVRDVRGWLEKLRLDLVFLNACSSGQAGWHSAWWQLRDLAPVVISNAMDALDDRAASYAQTFFLRWWGEHLDPVHAANVPPSQTVDPFDWAAAIAHSSYDVYSCIRRPMVKTHVADAEFWCDRDTQRAIAFKHVGDLCADRHQRAEAIIGYGQPGNHIEALPRQCIDYLHSTTQSIRIRRIPVSIPIQRGSALTTSILEERLKMDFSARMSQNLTDIFRAKAPTPMADTHRVLWLDWGVMKNQTKYREDLETWLKFVRDNVAPHVPEDIRVVASMQVEADKDTVNKLAAAMPQYRGKKEYRTDKFWCTILAPLDDVTYVDIVAFLHRNDCPQNFVEDVARAIFQETGGAYAATAKWLRKGIDHHWTALLDELVVPAPPSMDF